MHTFLRLKIPICIKTKMKQKSMQSLSNMFFQVGWSTQLAAFYFPNFPFLYQFRSRAPKA